MRPRRGLLFMPGDDRRKIEKGAALDVDAIIMDLEDGVALDRKDAARQTTASALRELDFGRTETLVRINPVTTDLRQADLASVLDDHPDGIVIPKVESAAQVAQVSEQIAFHEMLNGWREGEIVILAILESALGILNAREIAASNPRLVALCFGAEDLAADIGAIRTSGMSEVATARSLVVLTAKAYGLQAIDTPYTVLGDTDGLIAETNTALHMGYTGKLAIHPNQIAPIQTGFTPTNEQIERARRLIAAHDDHQRSGVGVFAFEGRMIDMPMIRAAQQIIARVQRKD